MELLHRWSTDGYLSIYKVNSSIMVVPSFGLGRAEFDLVHVKDHNCNVKQCKSLRNVHALAKKTSKLCIHNLLVFKGGSNVSEAEDPTVLIKADHIKTVDVLLKQVSKNFPSLNEEELKAFLPKNGAFITELRCELICFIFCLMPISSDLRLI